MKKRDFKYIIKRVIIGVLIVLIVGNLNKCNVKADSPTDVYILNGRGSGSDSSCNIVGGNYCSTGTCRSFPTPQSFLLPYNEIYYSLKPSVFSCTGTPNFAATKNPNGYYFVLTTLDNTLKYYFYAYDSSTSSTPSQLVINMVNFVYSSDDNNNYVKVVFYDEDGNDISSRVKFISFLVSDKNDLEINDTYLQSHMFNGIWQKGNSNMSSMTYGTQVYDNLKITYSNIYSQTLWFFDKEYFQYLKSDTSYSPSRTIPFLTIDDVPFENIEWSSGLEQYYTYGSDTPMANTLVGYFPYVDDFRAWLGFLEIPFNFLRGLTSGTCSPIEIPIPFTDSTIELPCIRSLIETNLPTIYTIIVIVINGLLVYRITIHNIDTFTDTFKPEDDKLEVIDL